MSGSIWKKEISLRRKAQSPEPPVADDGEPVTDAPPLPAGDYGWLTDDFDPAEVPAAMPSIAPPVVDVPAPVAAAPEAEPAAPVVAETEAQPAVPFWKREVSLSRKPKAPKPEKPKKEQKQKKQAATEHDADSAPSVPPGDFGWLTTDFDPNEFRPDAMPAIAASTVKAPEARADNVPFWKRDLGPSRKPKAEKREKPEKKAKEAKPPFWKRELSLSRTPKAAAEPKEPKQPKEKQPPFWKRELSLSKPKLEKTGSAKTPKQPKAKAAKTPAKGSIVGLKIGASQVAAARVTNGSSPQLLQVAREPLADGVVVGGELRDVESLAEALKALFAKNKLPKKNVRLGIANNRIGVRTFEIAGIDEPRQLANAIRFRAQETLPIPLEEAALDWQVLSEWHDEESGQTVRRVLLVVAYRELVDRYIAACKKAGLRLTGIDLEAFAMLRALSEPPREGEAEVAGAQVVVNVGHDRSTFAVSDGKTCEFTRVLGWGGQSLSVAIARALDLTPSEARPIKHALSLVARAEEPEEFSPQTLATARMAVVTELQAFARELVSSLRFYQNQPGSLGIAEVVLTGGSAHLPGFAEELHRLIGVPVRVGDPLNRVALPKKFQTPDEVGVGSLTVAIGLGIED